jgi:hypothetical protein
MFWPYLICAYVCTGLLLGLMFHLAAWFDRPASPRTAEIVVFFLVFSMIGIPLVVATLLFASPAIANNQLSKRLVSTKISQS